MDFKIVKRANVLVKKAYYTAERFDVKATFALLYHELPLSVVELAKHVRVSDQLMSLDSNHFFIIFAFTEQDNAYKASQNIVYSLDSYFNNNTSCIALDAFNPSKSPQSVLNRLELILAETRKNLYIRIETEDILDRR